MGMVTAISFKGIGHNKMLSNTRLTASHSLLVSLILHSMPLLASSEFSARVSVKEQFISNDTALIDETGQLTIISPGFTYTNTQKHSELSLDYAYNINRNNGLSNNNSEHNSLSLLYGFTHIPEHWVTQLTGNIQQTSVNSEGIQSFNPELNIDNTKELRTYGISSAFNARIKQQVNLKTRLLADVADYKGSDNTDSLGLDLSLDNKVSQNKFFWNTSINNRKSNSGSDNTEEISSYQLGLNYRFNSKYTAYINAQTSDTSNNDLNETSTLAGLNWQPSKMSHFDLAVGTRGSDKTYSLNSRFIKKRLSLSINYNETITSARNEVLQTVTDGAGNTSTYQSLDIIPVLQKKAAINLALSGRRSEGTLSYSSQIRSQNDGSDDEEIDALSLLLTRNLSSRSSMAFKYQLQNSMKTEENDLTRLQLTYNRVLSRHVNFNAELSSTKQQSDVVENEYKQNLIAVGISATF